VIPGEAGLRQTLPQLILLFYARKLSEFGSSNPWIESWTLALNGNPDFKGSISGNNPMRGKKGNNREGKRRISDVFGSRDADGDC
jgi:hypothetical protein